VGPLGRDAAEGAELTRGEIVRGASIWGSGQDSLVRAIGPLIRFRAAPRGLLRRCWLFRRCAQAQLLQYERDACCSSQPAPSLRVALNDDLRHAGVSCKPRAVERSRR